MITKGSIRRKSKEIFKKVITLRKQGHSYSEIRKETGLAKSTINNWITFAGLNLSQKHLQIQSKKRLENHRVGTIASRITRLRKKNEDIQLFIQDTRKYLNDPFFIAGIILYESEGSKGNNNGFSNSDYRLNLIYIRFLEKYFLINRKKNLKFRLYIHETRQQDELRIKNFWVRKLKIDRKQLKVSWKHNIVSKKRINLNYIGQFNVHVSGVKYFTGKILAISDIILQKYQKI